MDFAGRPAHMSALDFVLWQRWRRLGPLPYLVLYVDVAVGPGADAGAGVDPVLVAAWSRITRQRIDVVGESAVGWAIIEIRAAAGPGALGSLMVYRDLWLSDPPDPRPVSLILVTDSIAEALKPSLVASGVSLVLV